MSDVQCLSCGSDVNTKWGAKCDNCGKDWHEEPIMGTKEERKAAAKTLLKEIAKIQKMRQEHTLSDEKFIAIMSAKIQYYYTEAGSSEAIEREIFLKEGGEE